MSDVLLKVGETQSGLVDLPNPSSLKWSLQDISDGESGRDDAGYMFKAKIGQKIKLEVSWQAVSPSDASTILNAVDPEYIYVRYFDAKQGTYRVMEAYVGDRSAPVKIWSDSQQIYESLSFDIIER